MNVATSRVAFGARHPWLRSALAADAVAVSGLIVLVAMLVAVTWGAWGDLDSDTGYDIEAGRRAGCTTILLGANAPANGAASGADWHAQDWTEVVERIVGGHQLAAPPRLAAPTRLPSA